MARSPRVSGARCGVKTTPMGLPATSESVCSISGVWRCFATPYASTDSFAWQKCVRSVAARPAPLTPDIASDITRSPVAMPLSSAGMAASAVAVG